MVNASLDSLIKSSRKAVAGKAKKIKDDLDGDLDMDLDEGTDSAESKKARRSKRRVAKDDKKAEKAEKKAKKGNRGKKADKVEKPAKKSKKDRKSKKAAKADKSTRGSKKSSGGTDIVGKDLQKFLKSDKAPKPGKFDGSDPVSVGNHFMVGVHKTMRSEYSTSEIARSFVAGAKEAFGARLSPKLFDKAVAEVHSKLLAQTAKSAKTSLASLRGLAKGNGVTAEDVADTVEQLFDGEK